MDVPYQISFNKDINSNFKYQTIIDIFIVMAKTEKSLNDFIEKHNKIHGIGPMGSLNRISHGVKFYGTVYVQIVKLVEMWFDEDDIEQESTNINPQKDDISWGVRDEIYDQLLTRLYKFLPDTLYNIDVELSFRTYGV